MSPGIQPQAYTAWQALQWGLRYRAGALALSAAAARRRCLSVYNCRGGAALYKLCKSTKRPSGRNYRRPARAHYVIAGVEGLSRAAWGCSSIYL